MAATTAGVEEIVGGSPTPRRPYGAFGIGELEHVQPDRRHVQDGGNQVVGEGRVAHQAVRHLDLLHHRQAEALGDAALDLALDGLRVQCLAHILRGGDLHHLHQAELGVHVDHRPVGGERVLHVGLALAGLRVQRMGGPVPPGHRLLGRLVEQLGQLGPVGPGAQAGGLAREALLRPAVKLRPYRLARGPDRAAGHVGLPGR